VFSFDLTLLHRDIPLLAKEAGRFGESQNRMRLQEWLSVECEKLKVLSVNTRSIRKIRVPLLNLLTRILHAFVFIGNKRFDETLLNAFQVGKG